MAAGNRLTREQLAALAPGDTVTIETGSDLGRSRHTSGTVVRTGPFHVVVRVAGPRGGTFIERYSLRDGLRDSGRAELVTTDAGNPATGTSCGAARSASTPRTAGGAAAATTWQRYANCKTPSATT